MDAALNSTADALAVLAFLGRPFVRFGLGPQGYRRGSRPITARARGGALARALPAVLRARDSCAGGPAGHPALTLR
jgi:hypothetical protein